MNAIPELLVQSLEKVLISFSHNWPFLVLSVLISVGLRLYTDPQKISAFLTRYRKVGVAGATAAAVATPLCSCGTTAVILGMIATTIPWAPIVAFMVASPLTSPEGLVYSAGLFGWPFAIAYFVSSILLGFLGGAVAEFFESRGWLANQARFNRQDAPGAVGEPQKLKLAISAAGCSCETARRPVVQSVLVRDVRPVQSLLIASPVLVSATCCTSALPAAAVECSCSSAVPVVAAPATCGCGSAQPIVAEGSRPASAEQFPPAAQTRKVTPRQWLDEIFRTGKQLLVMFLGFAFIGYVLNGLIPSAWVAAVFGPGNVYSVPLAATLGLPFYINSEGSLPLVRALIDGGMSQGAAMAFLITGAGTSLGAVAGALTIARWRVIALVIGTLWVGSVALGYAYDLMLAMHLF